MIAAVTRAAPVSAREKLISVPSALSCTTRLPDVALTVDPPRTVGAPGVHLPEFAGAVLAVVRAANAFSGLAKAPDRFPPGGMT